MSGDQIRAKLATDGGAVNPRSDQFSGAEHPSDTRHPKSQHEMLGHIRRNRINWRNFQKLSSGTSLKELETGIQEIGKSIFLEQINKKTAEQNE